MRSLKCERLWHNQQTRCRLYHHSHLIKEFGELNTLWVNNGIIENQNIWIVGKCIPLDCPMESLDGVLDLVLYSTGWSLSRMHRKWQIRSGYFLVSHRQLMVGTHLNLLINLDSCNLKIIRRSVFDCFFVSRLKSKTFD